MEKSQKLNIGCASRLIEGYLNIDTDSLAEIKSRYPHLKINDEIMFLQADFFDLDIEENSISEIRADAVIEHFSFENESKFFYKAQRILKPGGILRFSVPDFEDLVNTWIKAEDDWKDFFSTDPGHISQQHWFGTYTYKSNNRWGYLMARFFGPQNGDGQFHRNAYTEKKLIAMAKKLSFTVKKIDKTYWKDDPDRDLMLDVEFVKN